MDPAPTVRIRRAPWTQWSPAVRQALSALTYKRENMRAAIRDVPEDLVTWVAFCGHEPVAWATRSPRWCHRLVDGVSHRTRQLPAPAVMVFVRQDHRRRGLGTRLLRAAARGLDEAWVLPHGRASVSFLSACLRGRHVQDLGGGFGWVVRSEPPPDDPPCDLVA